jgi:hypothetical protein
MAKYLLNPDYTRPIGSIGGACFQKIGGVFTIRHRSVPTDKRSIRQTQSRMRFDSIQKNYKTLSSPGKASFADLSINFPRVNSLGETYYVSGPNLQASSNISLNAANLPVLDFMQGPVDYPIFHIEEIAVQNSTSFAAFVIEPNNVPEFFSLLLYATRPLPYAGLSDTEIFRLIHTFPAGVDTSDFNGWNAYSSVYGNTTGFAGYVVYAYFQMLSIDNGQRGSTVSGSGKVYS